MTANFVNLWLRDSNYENAQEYNGPLVLLIKADGAQDSGEWEVLLLNAFICIAL